MRLIHGIRPQGVMAIYHQLEMNTAANLGIATEQIECSTYGINSEDYKDIDFNGDTVYARHYAGQAEYYSKFITSHNGIEVNPRSNVADQWYCPMSKHMRERYFRRRLGYFDTEQYGFLEEVAQADKLALHMKCLFEDYAPFGKLFLKSSDKYTIASKLYTLDEAIYEITYHVSLACHARLRTVIWSEEMAIMPTETTGYGVEEYRCFVVDGECSTISIYTDKPGEASYEDSYVKWFVTNFAKDCRLYVPILPQAYCLDIARLADGTLSVVELNDISSSRYFADHDIKKLYKDLERSSHK